MLSDNRLLLASFCFMGLDIVMRATRTIIRDTLFVQDNTFARWVPLGMDLDQTGSPVPGFYPTKCLTLGDPHSQLPVWRPLSEQ
jgi:hypothetical protein